MTKRDMWLRFIGYLVMPILVVTKLVQDTDYELLGLLFAVAWTMFTWSVGLVRIVSLFKKD